MYTGFAMGLRGYSGAIARHQIPESLRVKLGSFWGLPKICLQSPYISPVSVSVSIFLSTSFSPIGLNN